MEVAGVKTGDLSQLKHSEGKQANEIKLNDNALRDRAREREGKRSDAAVAMATKGRERVSADAKISST